MSEEKTAKGRVAGKRNESGNPLGANSEIGRKLRQYYDGLISQEIPDRFSQLLSQLEKEDENRPAGEED